MNEIIIIALTYYEPEYKETVRCIQATGLPVIWADRDGVGNYSRAFNEAFYKVTENYKYAWMVSNVLFSHEVPKLLAEAMDNTGFAGIHPAMPGSDHRHQWPDCSGEVKEVPFIEWTAPIVRTDIFKRFPLHNQLAYFYMDLQWSYEVKQAGYKTGVHHGASVNHVYLRNNMNAHPISKIRKQLRNWWTPRSAEYMRKLHGDNWKQKLNWHG